jgi:hypothetical protein
MSEPFKDPNILDENLVPSYQVGGGENSAIIRHLMGRLDDVGRQIVVDFLSGHPYREPSSIRADIEAGRQSDSR